MKRWFRGLMDKWQVSWVSWWLGLITGLCIAYPLALLAR